MMKLCIVVGRGANMKCGVGDYAEALYSHLKGLTQTELIITKGRKIREIIRAVRSLNPDIVVFQYPSKEERIPLLLFLLKILLPGTVMVTTLHEFKHVHILRSIISLPLILFSRKLIVSHALEKEAICQVLPMAKSKIEVIPIGANIVWPGLTKEEARSEARKRFNCNGELLIGYFGFIRPDKNVEDLLLAFKAVSEQGHPVRLVLISELNQGLKYHRQIRRLINELDIEDKTSITGYCQPEAVARYLMSLDIAVFAFAQGVSLNRGSFLAALSHGLACVTTRGGRIPQGLMSGENVLFAALGRKEELTQRMAELITSASLRTKLGAGAKIFASRFSWPQIANRHMQVYKEALHNS